MNEIIFDILNYVNEGITILDDKLDILFWNNYMEYLTNIDHHQVSNTNILKAIPKLNKSYFKKALSSALEKDDKFFFSSEMHKSLISDKFELNLRFNSFEYSGSKYLILEFIDVTSQFIRINQLKNFANKLSSLNNELKEKKKEIERLAYYDKLTNVANRTLFYTLAENLLANVKSKVKIDDDIEINIFLSIGVSFYPQDGNTIDELITKADQAMYNVKNIGGNRCIHYING